MKKFLALFLATIAILSILTSCQSGSGGGDITIGSKGFTEQDVLQELLAQQIENTTNLTVGRPRLVGFVAHKAITSGELDMYVEYTGTAFTGILEQKPIADPKEVYRRLKAEYDRRFNLEVLPSLGFENTFAMVIRGDDAQRYSLQTLSQLAKYAPEFRTGFGYEFVERADGYPGLVKTYDLQFKQSPKTMDLGLIYRALIQKQVDLVAGNSTDGQIARLGLVILKDDKGYFPPYEATPIVRKATLQKYPQVREAIAQLTGKISAAEMQQLNYLVEGELKDVKDVVRGFLQAKGLSQPKA